MRPQASSLSIALVCSCLGCVPSQPQRQDEPDRETQEFAFRFVEQTLICIRKHQPTHSGQVILVAKITPPHTAPMVNDAGSIAGSEATIECARRNVQEKLRAPRSPPSEFVKLWLPVPVNLDAVRFRFTDDPNEP